MKKEIFLSYMEAIENLEAQKRGLSEIIFMRQKKVLTEYFGMKMEDSEDNLIGPVFIHGESVFMDADHAMEYAEEHLVNS